MNTIEETVYDTDGVLYFKPVNEYMGHWEIGGPEGLSLYLKKKPNVFHRYFVKLFFGIKWING